MPEFDSYSDSYSEALQSGLKISGESQEFFAEGRISLVARRVEEFRVRPASVLDFGCGQGSSTRLLVDMLGAESGTGVDVSSELLRIAARGNTDARVSYARIADVEPWESFDVAYTNGVFHHIVPAERLGAMQYVFRALHAGGLFALWENNPWNPGTRIVMRRIPFDKDAQMLTIASTKRLAHLAGFEVIAIDSAFFFPRFLGALRRFEPLLSPTRLGGQYMVLCRKPA